MKKLFAFLLSLTLFATSVLAYFPITRVRNFVNDKNNGIPITASYMDAEFNQILTAVNSTGIVQSTAPSSPNNGQLWFDTTNNVLKVFRFNEWINYSPVFGGTAYMATPQKGDLFVNWNSFPNLQEYTGTNWINATFLNSAGINWTDVNLHSTINTGAVNWPNFTTNNLPSKGVNWQDIPGDAIGKFLQDNGNNTVNWATPLRIQIFTSSGTWTAPIGVTQAYLTELGGGGGGGSGANTGSNSRGGGGGASGAYVINRPYAVVPLSSYTVTIGGGGNGGAFSGNDGAGGGTTTFDALSVTGGGGGVQGGSSAGTISGGTPTGGTSTSTASAAGGGGIFVGTAGGSTSSGSAGGGQSGGGGGGSPFGSGANGSTTTGAPGSNAASNTGGGGGGGDTFSGSSSAGGNGGSGLIIVQW